MILQEKEKHNTGNLSSKKPVKSITLEQEILPACPPRPTGRTDSQPAISALEAFNRMVLNDGIDPRCLEFDCEKHELAVEMPRLVTRGPHTPQYDTPHPQKTKIDTLSFTAKESFFIMQDLLILSCKSPDLKFLPRKSGINGYLRGFNIVLNCQDLGTLSYGSAHNDAQNERPQIYIEGSGKTDKFDWAKFHYYANLLDSPKIKRIDICIDTFNAEFTIESAIQAHIDLKFKALKANKNPKITPYGQIQPDGTNPGRTVYIGSLQSSKFIRFYEKGYEIYKNELNKDDTEDQAILGIQKLFQSGEETIIDNYNDGKAFDLRKWIRAEVEIKDGNCEISIDTLLETDKYFAGAYPYCEEILKMTDGKKPKRLMTDSEMEFEKRALNHKAITGSFIEDALYLGYSNDEIILMLRSGKGPSQKLIKSGGLPSESE